MGKPKKRGIKHASAEALKDYVSQHKPKPAWLWLWLATDGEVRVSEKMPLDGGSGAWLGFPTPFTNSIDVDIVVQELCDLSKTNALDYPTKPSWYFRCDPRTQRDLAGQFRRALEGAIERRKT
jgi:hypothetical protein